MKKVIDEKYVGKNYEKVRNLDLKDIAKFVRIDLKDEFPKFKFSVRIDRFSQGRSIDIFIKKSPFNPINLLFDPNDHRPGSNARLYHVETRSFLKDVENVLARYNYDKGGSHVNFWGDVQFDTKYEKKCINKVLNHTQQNTVETPLGIASVVVPSG